MRMLMQVSIPVDAGNAAISNGTLAQTIESVLTALKPEAAYFVPNDNGERCGYIILDMADTSQIPAIAEPWFLAFNARVTMRPAMNIEDLKKAKPGIERAVKAFAKGAGTSA